MASYAFGLTAMRVRGSAAELRALLRRWAGFVFVVAAVLGPYFTTLIAWPATPLFWATQQPWGLALTAIFGHALPAILLCWALREQLLPARWLPAEAALPLRLAQRLRADVAVLALVQAPWVLLNLMSMLAWWRDSPVWLHGRWPGVLAGCVGSLLISTACGVLILHGRRRSPAAVRPAAAGPPQKHAEPRASLWFNLLCLPLWRGPARPALHMLWLALLLPLLSLGLAWALPQQASWALALFCLLVMILTAGANSQIQRCFEPLRQAAQVLPVGEVAWVWRLRALALLPALLAWAALAGMLVFGPWALAPRATPLFVLWGLLAPALAIGFQGGSAELRAGRWLLLWAIWVALASEVLM